MFDRLPPVQTLRAFEATARLLSMTRAAEELHLTHGAVSRHIRTLEDDLGCTLFQRLTRRIVLTQAGAEFHAVVARLLGELAGEAQRLRGDDTGNRLTVSTSVSFASKWLAPRLGSLRASCQPFDVHMDVTDVNVDLRAGHVDVAIRYGFGRYPNTMSERILEEAVTPVCSPDYLAGCGGLEQPAQLLRTNLLHEVGMMADWAQWFALAGSGKKRPPRGPSYSHGSMAVEAAIRGEGVALARSTLVADDIAAGRLVAPFPELRLKAERGYDLVYRVGERNHAKVVALRNWLGAEIAAFRSGGD
jgi:LysR family glycine cleavage system transcriptional activator